MAALQVRRWSGHAAVEAIQNERSGGEGALEAPGAGAEIGSGGRDSDCSPAITFVQNVDGLPPQRRTARDKALEKEVATS